MSVLDQILATKRDEVAMLHRPGVSDALQARALTAPPPRDFLGALVATPDRLAVVAELKRRSPSKGDLAPALDPEATARAYERGGAACLSVLTDGPFFGGTEEDLRVARAATTLPTLRKDFTIDVVQCFESRAIGADALLLIVAALPDEGILRELHACATELGLAAVVEAHDAAELDRALDAGARIVGINARDLDTFEEDLSTGVALTARIPTDVVAVAESAIRSVDDARRMAEAGFDAVLVGEAFVRTPNPTSLVRALASIERRPREG